ncbi:MAG: GTP-binding protein, partial [Methylobacteriaceae bacterium]|nr:GTP-binding protein [Methylobacteriaceae bacterium]
HDHDHDHAHRHAHGHDVNRHDAHIRAFCLTWDKPVPPHVFDLFLELLKGAHGPKLLRVKGLVMLADDPARPVVLHGVQHVIHPVARLAAWPDGERLTRMVFIVRDLEPAFVAKLWEAFTGALAAPA